MTYLLIDTLEKAGTFVFTCIDNIPAVLLGSKLIQIKLMIDKSSDGDPFISSHGSLSISPDDLILYY